MENLVYVKTAIKTGHCHRDIVFITGASLSLPSETESPSDAAPCWTQLVPGILHWALLAKDRTLQSLLLVIDCLIPPDLTRSHLIPICCCLVSRSRQLDRWPPDIPSSLTYSFILHFFSPFEGHLPLREPCLTDLLHLFCILWGFWTKNCLHLSLGSIFRVGSPTQSLVLF